ncbi:hypothetical protein L2236_25415, partial [Xanthomonas perforans]|nr:hypothetical protein [Xanthomonas perforans]
LERAKTSAQPGLAARDHQALDFRGALVDFGNFGIAESAPAVPRAAAPLERAKTSAQPGLAARDHQALDFRGALVDFGN